MNLQNKSNMLVSIVMAYYNRKDQLIQTLDCFKELYEGKYNFEVIIVDDKSDDEHDLQSIIYKYKFMIKLIKISKKEWINPVVPYNIGFSIASGEYIIIQNPEIFHTGDIIKYALDKLNDNVYLTFPVFSSPSFIHNTEIKNLLNKKCNNYYDEFIAKINYEMFDFDYHFYKKKYNDIRNLNMDMNSAYNHWINYGIKNNRQCNESNIFYRKNVIYEWKGWYNHIKYNPRNLHFLSALKRNLLNKIGGFCNDYKDGLWYDDNDFIERIKKVAEVKLIDSKEYIGIHLYHINGSDDQHLNTNFDQLMNKNKQIYEYNKKNNVIYCNPTVNNIEYKMFNNDEYIKSNYKIGLCFKIYADASTTEQRYEIIKEFISSLECILNNYNNLLVVGVVDCKPNEKLNAIIKNMNPLIKMLLLGQNKGISFATNIGIEYLLNHSCDYIFCSDDDIIFLNKNILQNYIDAMIENKIPHFGYYPIEQFKHKYDIVNEKLLKYLHGYSGCFYCFTKNVIYKYGYLPIMSGTYGYEHEQFTKLITQHQYDINNSNKLIKLNDKSIKAASGNRIINEKYKTCKLDPFTTPNYYMSQINLENLNLNLYYIICSHQQKKIYNVGDMFGKFVIEQLFNTNIHQVYTVLQSSNDSNNIFQLVGSIIRDSHKDMIILGTGILAKTDVIKSFKACHLVRGKITLERLKQSHPNNNFDHVKLGDPGLILNYFIDKKVEKKYDYGIMLHYLDNSNIKQYFTDECLSRVKIINVDNPNIIDVANQMLSCKNIITSSLHGIIFSHSLNIPVSWIRLNNTLLPSDDIKFYDYLSIYNIENIQSLCHIIKNKLEFNGLLLLKPIIVDINFINQKRREIFQCIVDNISMYNYELKSKYYNCIYDNNIGVQLLCNQIKGNIKFNISRIGGIEYDTYCDYLKNGYRDTSQFYNNMFKLCGYYDLDNSKDIFIKYVNKYESCIKSATLLLVCNNVLESYLKFLTIDNPYYFDKTNNESIEYGLKYILDKQKISYYIIESFEYLHEYYPLFENRKILIISPFEQEIRIQLEKKDKLFTSISNFKYPNFAKVEYLNTYLTTNNYETPHRNWYETFKYYKTIIKEKDFDIALLICGCYAYPIADYIYNKLNKSCIHIGGIGQLLFGIKGGRYHSEYFTKMMNENWIYPNTVITKNAPGIPSYDGLLGYFGRK